MEADNTAEDQHSPANKRLTEAAPGDTECAVHGNDIQVSLVKQFPVERQSAAR